MSKYVSLIHPYSSDERGSIYTADIFTIWEVCFSELLLRQGKKQRITTLLLHLTTIPRNKTLQHCRATLHNNTASKHSTTALQMTIQSLHSTVKKSPQHFITLLFYNTPVQQSATTFHCNTPSQYSIRTLHSCKIGGLVPKNEVLFI